MRIVKSFGGIAAIACATAFAGCQCSVNGGTPPQTPPPATTATTAEPTTANPPPPAPMPASLKARLAQHPDGGV